MIEWCPLEPGEARTSCISGATVRIVREGWFPNRRFDQTHGTIERPRLVVDRAEQCASNTAKIPSRIRMSTVSGNALTRWHSDSTRLNWSASSIRRRAVEFDRFTDVGGNRIGKRA